MAETACCDWCDGYGDPPCLEGFACPCHEPPVREPDDGQDENHAPACTDGNCRGCASEAQLSGRTDVM